MNILGRAEGKLVVKKAVGSKSSVELSVQIALSLVFEFCVTSHFSWIVHLVFIFAFVF